MRKRGQVSVFIIIGIVAVIAVILVYFLRSNIGLFTPPQDFLRGTSENIQKNIGDCADTYSKDGLRLMLDQGGKINPVSYRLYEGKKVGYLCTVIPGDIRCMNNLEPLSSWQEDFSRYLKLNLDQCINLDVFKSDFGAYEIKYDGYDISTEFLDEKVVVSINPKINLVKGDSSLPVGSVIRSYDTPIGTLHKVAFDVIEGRTKAGDFYNLQYMISKKGQIEIVVDDMPYPDTIYTANIKDNNNKLYFAVQGEESEVL